MVKNINSVPSKSSQKYTVFAVSWLVGLYGLYVIATTLFDQIETHRLRLLNGFVIDTHLLLGIGFVYLSILLARRKRNALIVAIIAFAFMLVVATGEVINHFRIHPLGGILALRLIIMPLVVMIALLITRNEFKVRSDQAAFRNSVKLAVLVLVITLAYGVGGFMLMDKSDFHQEISITSALHHTVDQFDLTTNAPLHPYTKRAKLFMDSLSFISVVSIAYLALSLFIPVRLRLLDQATGRDRIKKIMEDYGAPSEDFFKVWPKDKHYFFSASNDAALAYHVKRGIALVIADPIGNKSAFKKMFTEFQDMCWANDWQPALIHVDQRFSEFYKDNGFQLQLIGQEAVVDIKQFVDTTANNKYFRNIRNRFNRENFRVEIIEPPHHKAVLDRLRVISDEWLSRPGRAERGVVMGYYDEAYIQQCRVVLVRDAAQTIQAFMNLLPTESFNTYEASYDMLRGTKEAPSNINDFLLFQLLHTLKEEGYTKFNLGLCPLVGLDELNDENSLIASVLRFAYVNGDRIYSFSGLHRFKDKYDPIWGDKYIAYKGGVRGFTRMLNALVLAMKVKN